MKAEHWKKSNDDLEILVNIELQGERLSSLHYAVGIAFYNWNDLVPNPI